MKPMTVAEAASIASKDRATIRARIKEAGLEPIKLKGQSKIYDSAVLMQAVFGAKRTDGKILDLQAESARLKHAQANKTEMEIAEKEGVLVNANEMADEFAKMIMECRAKLLTLPKKLALVAAPENIKEAELEAERLVHESLEELATQQVGVMEATTETDGK